MWTHTKWLQTQYVLSLSFVSFTYPLIPFNLYQFNKELMIRFQKCIHIFSQIYTYTQTLQYVSKKHKKEAEEMT